MRVDVDVEQLTRKLNAVEKRNLPFALSQALNRTAEQAQQAATAGMKVFDRPVPFTTKSVFIRRTTKAQFTSGLFAEVFLRDEATKGTPPVKYLEPEVKGGSRRVKRFERALRAEGIMGPNEWAVPSRALKLNQYGNVSAGMISSILSQLEASPDNLQNVTRRSKQRLRKQGKRLYFTPRPGSKLKPGVYVRTGRRPKSGGDPRDVRPVLLFVSDAPTYRPRYQFFEIVTKVYQRRFASIFHAELARAVATDRGY